MMRRSLTITQPTAGFGGQLKRAFLASSSARRIYEQSENSFSLLTLILSGVFNKLDHVVQRTAVKVDRTVADIGHVVELFSSSMTMSPTRLEVTSFSPDT